MVLKGKKRNGQKLSFTSNHIASSRQEGLKRPDVTGGKNLR